MASAAPATREEANASSAPFACVADMREAAQRQQFGAMLAGFGLTPAQRAADAAAMRRADEARREDVEALLTRVGAVLCGPGDYQRERDAIFARRVAKMLERGQ